jgi:hypothetical protein
MQRLGSEICPSDVQKEGVGLPDKDFWDNTPPARLGIAYIQYAVVITRYALLPLPERKPLVTVWSVLAHVTDGPKFLTKPIPPWSARNMQMSS